MIRLQVLADNTRPPSVATPSSSRCARREEDTSRSHCKNSTARPGVNSAAGIPASPRNENSFCRSWAYARIVLGEYSRTVSSRKKASTSATGCPSSSTRRTAGSPAPAPSTLITCTERTLRSQMAAMRCLLRHVVVQITVSDVLETGPHLSRYFLSPRAARGIFRRAARGRGRWPELLLAALAVVAQQTSTGTAPTSLAPSVAAAGTAGGATTTSG